MKKITLLLLVSLLLALQTSVLAARRQAEDVPENPMDWSISTKPPMS